MGCGTRGAGASVAPRGFSNWVWRRVCREMKECGKAGLKACGKEARRGPETGGDLLRSISGLRIWEKCNTCFFEPDAVERHEAL